MGIYKGTNCLGDTIFTSQVTSFLVHAIEKDIRSLFTDWVTNSNIFYTIHWGTEILTLPSPI